MRKIKKYWNPFGAWLGPRAGAEAGAERNLKKIDEIQVIKIKKYARFLLKSCYGNISDKNAAIFDKVFAKWPIYIWGFDCAKEIDFSSLL